MKRPNPLPPDRMTPAERRAELSGLLARGVLRLLGRNRDQLAVAERDGSLHFPPEQSGTAGPTHRRSA
jgi:hypothetical protein